MTEQAKKYLADIIQAITLINEFTADVLNYSEYVADLKTQSAVERQLGIIGEAVNKFEKLQSETPLESAKKIVGFRNRLIHSYDNIDSSILWAILKNHLAPLKEEIEQKLK
jgi:uncharacterized protein with HEPN domain